MKKNSLFIFLLSLGALLQAQPHTDFLGAGHMGGIVVTTSHNETEEGDGYASVDGFPVADPTALKDASRFLAQATMGYDYASISMVAAMGYEAWLEEQWSLPTVDILAYSDMVEEAIEIDDKLKVNL